MKIIATASDANGLVFTRETDRVYRWAVLYRREGHGYCTPSFHARKDLAERASMEVGPNVSCVGIVPVTYIRPTNKVIQNAINKEKARYEKYVGLGYREERLSAIRTGIESMDRLLNGDITIEQYLGMTS